MWLIHPRIYYNNIKSYFSDFNWRKPFMSKFAYKQWKNERVFYKRLTPYYQGPCPASSCQAKSIVFMADGRYSGGGLADKLKGIITLYKQAKLRGYSFIINWVNPFNLIDYLQPNTYDWQCDKDSLVYNVSYSYPFCLSYNASTEEKDEQCTFHKNMLNHIFDRNKHIKQFHIYTNATLFTDQEYHDLFNELFKPVERINQQLENCLKECGDNFVTASFRFIELLGDFKDEWADATLSPQERERYIQDGLAEIKKIHLANNNSQVLVATDSKTFLNRAQELPYVYVIPGNIAHTNLPSESNFDKEFLDLLMMAKSKQIYVFHRGQMWRSGFPVAASLIGNVPIAQIEF